MKRTPIKRLSKLSKLSKQPISKLQRKIWELCKQIVRKIHGNTCYTCGQSGLTGSNLHTGHVPWPKAALGAYLKYDLRLLRPQCATCNIFRGGMGAEAYKRMLSELGQKGMQKLEAERQITVKAYDHYLKVLDDYQKLIKEL